MSGTTTGTTIPSTRGRGGAGAGDIASTIAALANIFTSKNETTTQQTRFDPATLDAMLQRAFERNGGLATALGGGRRAGLYNSSTANLLTNDFTSRMAAEVAQRGAPTVTNVSAPAAINPLLALAGLGLLQARSPAGLGGIFGDKTKKAGDVASVTNPSGAATTSDAGSAASSFFDNPIGSLTSQISDSFSALNSALGFGGGSGANAVTDPGLISFTRPSPTLNAGSFADGELASTLDSGLNFARLGAPATAIGTPITTLDLGFAADPLGAVEKLNRSGGELITSGVGADGAFAFDSIPWTAGLSGLMNGDIEGAIGGVGKSYLGSVLGQALTPVLGPLGGILGALFGMFGF